MRIFQQFATADAISGGGRIEITAGRGSSVETFPLFGYDLGEYDELYAEKLDLLMAINNADTENVTWSGTVRPALADLAVVPRPLGGKLPIWLATGGNASSSARAGQLGLPVSYGIIGGAPHRFAPLAELYRRSGAQAGHPPDSLKVSVAALGLVAPTKKEALERFYPGWYNLNVEMGALRGWPAPDKRAYDAAGRGPGRLLRGLARRGGRTHRPSAWLHGTHAPLPADGYRRHSRRSICWSRSRCWPPRSSRACSACSPKSNVHRELS